MKKWERSVSMKKYIMIWLSILMLFSLWVPIKSADAAVIWNEWPERVNVPLDKTWKIKFNTPMDAETFNKDTVNVLNYKTLTSHPVTLQLSDDGKTLNVHPDKPYVLGDTYTLQIKQSVKSARGLEMKESIKLSFRTSRDFQIANMNGIDDYGLMKSYDHLNEAISSVKKDGSQVILENGEVVWMPDGIVKTKGFTIIYNGQDIESGYAQSMTYVNGGTELQYLDTVDGAIMIKIADQIGYVKPGNVNLIPRNFIEGRSYYMNVNGELIHYIYKNGHYVSYTYGPAPDGVEQGEKVYSWDGITFGDVAYPFFNQLSLRTKTNYTAEQLDEFVAHNRPNSPLVGMGDVFIEAQNKFNVNGLYLLAHAVHESSWGLSEIAKDKNNLYGLNATDDNPYGNAYEFKSLEANIMYAAKFVSESYLTPGNFRYHGDFLGNKAEGMNVMYASDPYWGQKIAGHMYRADELFGGLDRKLLSEQSQ